MHSALLSVSAVLRNLTPIRALPSPVGLVQSPCTTLQWPDHRLVGSRQGMGRAQMPLWVQLRRREIERQGEEEVTASLQLTRRRRHRLGSAVSS